MTYYTVCPTCGYKLCKAGDGSNILRGVRFARLRNMFPKCGDRMTIEIKDGKIIIQKILTDKT